MTRNKRKIKKSPPATKTTLIYYPNRRHGIMENQNILYIGGLIIRENTDMTLVFLVSIGVRVGVHISVSSKLKMSIFFFFFALNRSVVCVYLAYHSLVLFT